MELVLNRVIRNERYTIGHLYVAGDFYCSTLEPPVRDYEHGEKKVYGNSAIPKGKYAIKFSYSPSFRCEMPYLCSVPDFTGIMIHTGNTVKDTKGCILVGDHLNVGRIEHSRACFRMLKNRMLKALENKEDICITINEYEQTNN